MWSQKIGIISNQMLRAKYKVDKKKIKIKSQEILDLYNLIFYRD